MQFKTLIKQRTSETKRFCKFSLFPKGPKVIHGVYDRETDGFYALGKGGKPVAKRAYSNLKQFAVAYGCKPALIPHKISVNGKTLRQLSNQGMIFSWPFLIDFMAWDVLHAQTLTTVLVAARASAQELMQDFIPPPAPQPPAAIPLDQWTTASALRLQILQSQLDNSIGRAEAASHRLDRASVLLDQCKVRVASADNELSAAKLALADAQCEYDLAERDDDWENDAVEMNRDQLLVERAKLDVERFERERAANAP